MDNLFAYNPADERAFLLFIDIRNARGGETSPKETEQAYLDAYRQIHDRHDNYLGSAIRQYGTDSTIFSMIKQVSDKQRAKEIGLALDAYWAADENCI